MSATGRDLLVNRVLQYYADNPGQSIKEAADGLGAKRSSVGTAVYCLLARGKLLDQGGPIKRLEAIPVDD